MIYEKKKEMIAMLLAGGQGSRLGVLTDSVAKPAVPFGGKYRIIDFPLSNCINSGVDTIGVLTQYQPLELNAYIGSGQPWDLDRINGGVFILPPYVKGKAGEWYKGTANAIYQNMKFIEMYNPRHVLILSGDHIYKMNYDYMLSYHKEKGADCTIAVLKVPIEDASRFGVMNTDENLRIFEFEEKPKEPKSNLASMGIYIFSWEKLKEYLIKDENDEESEKDFGKNVIPAMLKAGEKMYAYEYKGYWKDVGTVESLWQSNMDILNKSASLNLYDPPWRIYSRNLTLPPQVIGDGAKLENASISEGCFIEGTVINSIIFPAVTIERGAVVSNSIIMQGCHIRPNALVEYAILAQDVTVEEEAQIGRWTQPESVKKHRDITVVGEGLRIPTGVMIPAGSMIDKNTKMEEME